MKAIPQVNVTISTATGKTVFAILAPKHEVEVLRFVHGPANVRVTGDADADDALMLPDSADAEWDRLVRKYQRANAPDPVRIAFPNGPNALREFGFSNDRGDYQEAPAAMVKKHKKAAPVETLGEPEKPKAKKD